MRAPTDIDLGGVLVDPFVRYLFLALAHPDRRSICRRPPGAEVDVRQSSACRSGDLRLHSRFPHGVLELSGGRNAVSKRGLLPHSRVLQMTQICWSLRRAA